MSENTEATESTETGTTPEGTGTDATDWQAEAEKWKAQSRKNEADKKENAKKLKEYDAWKESQLSENERAVMAAREEGAASVRAEFSAKLAATAFKSAAAGRLADPEKVLARVDVAQFLTDSGDPDEEAIADFIDSIAPAKADTETPAPASGLFQAQGARGDHLPLNGDPLLNKIKNMIGS
jgi:hypothetical protein